MAIEKKSGIKIPTLTRKKLFKLFNKSSETSIPKPGTKGFSKLCFANKRKLESKAHNIECYKIAAIKCFQFSLCKKIGRVKWFLNCILKPAMQ